MMDQNRCLLDVINDPQLLQSFLESASTNEVAQQNDVSTQQGINNNNDVSASKPDQVGGESDTHVSDPSTSVFLSSNNEDSFGALTVQDNASDEIDQVLSSIVHEVVSDRSVYDGKLTHCLLPEIKADNINNDTNIIEDAHQFFKPPELISNNKDSQDTILSTNSSVKIDAHESSYTQASVFTNNNDNDIGTKQTVLASPETVNFYSGHVKVEPLPTKDENIVYNSNTQGANAKVTTTVIKPTARKRPPKKPTTIKQPKAKNAKNADTTQFSTTPTSQPSKPPQQTDIQQQSHQQIVFQNTNQGIRQPGLMTSSIGQPVSSIGPQQRLIQIQTQNGPMFFAIAPGPAAINNNLTTNQTGMQSQQLQSQQICFQPNSVMVNRRNVQSQPRLQTSFISNNVATSGQQTSFGGSFVTEQQNVPSSSPASSSPRPNQHVRFTTSPVIQYSQPQNIQMSSSIATSNSNNSNIQQLRPTAPQYSSPGQMVFQASRPQNYNPSQVSNQGGTILLNGAQIMNSQQNARLANPQITGQTVAINNIQQGSLVQPQQGQQVMSGNQHQPMIMQRMPNQLILNRPTQLIPGQQQYIQIQTPNGAMLLALPQQSTHLNNSMIDYNSQIQQQSQQTPPKASAEQTKQNSTSDSTKNSKSDYDLADLLLEHGILPEDKNTGSAQPSNETNTSQGQPVKQMSSQMPMMTSSPMTLSQPMQQQSMQNLSASAIQQPLRIAFGNDGQMIVQQPIYGTMRPFLGSQMNQNMNSMNMVTNSSPINAVPSSQTNSNLDQKDSKGKGTKGSSARKNRSKKSDLDKFPTLKTPKRQQQQHKQQQMQSVATLVPINMLVDRSKILLTNNEEQKSGEILGQQVASAKIIAPVQTSTSQTSQSISSQKDLAQNHSNCLVFQDTKIFTVPASSLNRTEDSKIATLDEKKEEQIDSNQTGTTTTPQTNTGKVSTHILHKIINNSGTVESSSHISPSLMPTISLTVDNLKTDQNTIRTTDELVGNLKVGQTAGPIILINQSQAHKLKQQQQAERRARAILNQLEADQNAVLNPQIAQPFDSVEDACKRLLRYHVLNTPTINEEQLRIVDDAFEIASQSLITKKAALYNKFRLLVLKQSMETVPTSEELMIEQILLTEDQAQLRRERQLLDEFEAHVEKSYSKSKESPKDQSADYMTFNIQDDQDSEVNDWLIPDNWSRPFLADNEAALAIESILDMRD